MATIAEQLAHTWEAPASIVSWFTTVDHKRIGRRYLVTAFLFFVAAGIGALTMRLQLAQGQRTMLSPEEYDQLFTMHGTTMIFLFATPLLFGFGNFLVPLMIGARDMAFPRLNAFGYWVFLLAGLFLWSSLVNWRAPDAGWFDYVPLAGPAISPGHNIDYYTLALLFNGIATAAGAINFITTIFTMRAPGMSINRMPLFCWAMLVTSFAVIFALPPLNAANGMLAMDHLFGTHFFDPDRGGNVLLWQHLFWTFGHPDVYIIFLPAIGIVSSVVPVFARRPLAGYVFLAMATVATGIISFGVWVHHMFAVGLPNLSLSFFSAASVLITIPAGVQVVAWLYTIWTGRVVWATAFLFVAGFLALIVMGGVTGVMFALVPFDQQITDSYFVVAHFHYVLFGGAVFPMFAGFYYWFPKITGRMLNEIWGQVNFWLMFIGFNVTFFPMHLLGIWGMPRRVYTYNAQLGWGDANLTATIGAFILAAGILAFILNVVISLASGERAGDDPWRANTLEWATSSPPAPYNFAVIPVVGSANPLWDQARYTAVEPQEERWPVLAEGRESIATTTFDAIPESRLQMPGNSVWPLTTAIGLVVLFAGLLTKTWITIVIGIIIAVLSVLIWLWPHGRQGEPRAAVTLAPADVDATNVEITEERSE